MDIVRARNAGMHTAASSEAGTAGFRPRPTDVFVVTYPKCGTTWVTQIVHQLRTGGDMSFDEITEVVPWDILALDCGQDLAADQVAAPRLFKSHEPADQIARGARYIVVARDPLDAFISFYHFLPSYVGLPPGSLTVEEFADGIFDGVSHSGYIWDFLLGWWRRRAEKEVLWLCFEDLKEDLPREVRRIAAWLGYDADGADAPRVEAATANSSFEFMRSHGAQFDEHFTFARRRDAMGVPAEYVFGEAGVVGKVREGGGGVGGGGSLPPHVARRLEERWARSMQPETGCASYAAFRAALARERAGAVTNSSGS